MGFTLNKEELEPYEDYTLIAKESALNRLRLSAKEHLMLIRDMYEQQLEGIPVRISKRRNEMITAGIFFAFISFLVIACIGIYGIIGIFLSCWIIFWIAISIKDLYKSVVRYLLMTESKAFGLYYRYTDKFTYKDEEKYCRESIRKVDEKLAKLEQLQNEELEEYCRSMLTYDYEERRAYAVLGASDQRMI